jgi:hypothetical protein
MLQVSNLLLKSDFSRILYKTRERREKAAQDTVQNLELKCHI